MPAVHAMHAMHATHAMHAMSAMRAVPLGQAAGTTGFGTPSVGKATGRSRGGSSLAHILPAGAWRPGESSGMSDARNRTRE